MQKFVGCQTSNMKSSFDWTLIIPIYKCCKFNTHTIYGASFLCVMYASPYGAFATKDFIFSHKL